MKLEAYANKIHLFEGYPRPEPFADADENDALASVLEFLIAEEGRGRAIPQDTGERRLLRRALLNTRPAAPFPRAVLEALDKQLWKERLGAGLVDAEEIPNVAQAFGYKGGHAEVLALWRGDITRLDVDAIVNAANGALLGCFRPLHSCIDNAIHSAAGPRLRADCAIITAGRATEEPPGDAKITRAYNLPSRFVLHTVGPLVRGRTTDLHRRTLSSSYTACLELASETGRIKSLAFCCISTGVYSFPGDEAAEIAFRTVNEWLDRHPDSFGKIVFNVFTEEDHERYRRLFTR
jgi:O-acetyl-ADP-ribose deacetylase (regulator of RNase III)